jgi:hypothetical protein
MGKSKNQIQKALSRLHQRDNKDDIKFAQCFTNRSKLYATMAQQEYQMYQMRDYQIQGMQK